MVRQQAQLGVQVPGIVVGLADPRVAVGDGGMVVDLARVVVQTVVRVQQTCGSEHLRRHLSAR